MVERKLAATGHSEEKKYWKPLLIILIMYNYRQSRLDFTDAWYLLFQQSFLSLTSFTYMIWN